MHYVCMYVCKCSVILKQRIVFIAFYYRETVNTTSAEKKVREKLVSLISVQVKQPFEEDQ